VDTDLPELITRSGLKRTRRRSAILDTLAQSDKPLSAEQIFLSLQEQNIAINLSTVYRTLDTLIEHRLVERLSLSGDSRAVFEFNRNSHRHYLICVSCKKVIPIDSCPFQDYEKAIEAETDYRIEGHKLDIFGYCPGCKKMPKNGKN